MTLQEKKAGTHYLLVSSALTALAQGSLHNLHPLQLLTLHSLPIAYWIAFGPHGPRALPPPDETFKIVAYTAIGVAVAFVLIFAVRQFARPPPSTMNKEWQEQTNEFLKAQNVEPISGISSEGYVGPGQVQSKPKKKE